MYFIAQLYQSMWLEVKTMQTCVTRHSCQPCWFSLATINLFIYKSVNYIWSFFCSFLITQDIRIVAHIFLWIFCVLPCRYRHSQTCVKCNSYIYSQWIKTVTKIPSCNSTQHCRKGTYYCCIYALSN
jgi:hypothetical protein